MNHLAGQANYREPPQNVDKNYDAFPPWGPQFA